MRHIRACRICAGGAREWWKRHGLDWNDFLVHGIPVELLEATGDPFALKVVNKVREEADG